MGSRLGSLAALAVLALAALVSATWDGPVWESGDSGEERFGEDVDEALDRPPPEEGTPVERERPEAEELPRFDDLPGVTPWAWLVLAIVLGAVVVVLVALRLHFVRRRRQLAGDRDPRAGPTPVPDDTATDEDLEDLERRLDTALRDLSAGEPRNAIVAIWLHLERLLAARSFRRDAADTPTEYAARARASYQLDATALDDLAELYREARFSTHPLTEEHRARAHDCLRRLQAGLRAGAGERSP